MCFRTTAALLLAAALCPAQDYVDRIVERARQAFDVPGIAVAIVKDGQVVHLKGYGVRRLGDPAPVTEHTLFRIASNTKAFTSAALAILVDQKRLAWDDPVTQYLPAFQMYDPYVTREMTVRDLLTHRSGLGLGAGDLMFFPPGDLPSEEIVRRLRYIRPATSFRSTYAYDNLLYLVAGSIIPAVNNGQSWGDFLKARIFTPLGMTGTVTDTGSFKQSKDAAAPHNNLSGKLEPLPQEDVDNNAPAGAMVSNVADLSKWLLVQLNGGVIEGNHRLFSAAQAREMWTPVTIIPVAEPGKEADPAFAATRPDFSAYALGWGVRGYRGKKLVGHTGMLSGFVSRTALLPDLKLGIVVLTNAEAEGAHSAIVNTVLDHYLGAPETDWIAAYQALDRKERSDAEAAVGKAGGARRTDTRPSLPAAAYAGRYRDAWYGDIRIEEHEGKLSIYFTHTADLAGDLEHWQYDTFVARWKNRTLNADAFVTFSLKPDGSIGEMRMQAVSPLTDFSFDFQDLLFHPVPINIKPM
ncbi:MAG: serine hydrolase [Acidobacteriota bacterium]|nr:serine hydrolase [Acidobacteriota bacterium]